MKTVHEIKTAILRGEASIDIGNETVKLPTPQRTGTGTQIETYAYLSAVKILEKFKQ